MYENRNISRCVKQLSTEWKYIMSKETYTKKEYIELFDSMDIKLSNLRMEKEQLEFKLNEENKVSEEILKDKLKQVTALLTNEREKRKILESKIVEMTDAFLEITKKEYEGL